MKESPTVFKKGLDLNYFNQTHFIKTTISFFGDLFIKQAGYECT